MFFGTYRIVTLSRFTLSFSNIARMASTKVRTARRARNTPAGCPCHKESCTAERPLPAPHVVHPSANIRARSFLGSPAMGASKQETAGELMASRSGSTARRGRERTPRPCGRASSTYCERSTIIVLPLQGASSVDNRELQDRRFARSRK